MDRPRLEVGIYQIVDDCDAEGEPRRRDGLGMGLGGLAAGLDGRDAEPVCLSLPAAHDRQSDRLVGQEPGRLHGDLDGPERPGGDQLPVRRREAVWKNWVNSQFGRGIITWNTPFLFRTKPEGSRLLVCGPANFFKATPTR